MFSIIILVIPLQSRQLFVYVGGEIGIEITAHVIYAKISAFRACVLADHGAPLQSYSCGGRGKSKSG